MRAGKFDFLIRYKQISDKRYSSLGLGITHEICKLTTKKKKKKNVITSKKMM